MKLSYGEPLPPREVGKIVKFYKLELIFLYMIKLFQIQIIIQ